MEDFNPEPSKTEDAEKFSDDTTQEVRTHREDPALLASPNSEKSEDICLVEISSLKYKLLEKKSSNLTTVSIRLKKEIMKKVSPVRNESSGPDSSFVGRKAECFHYSVLILV